MLRAVVARARGVSGGARRPNRARDVLICARRSMARQPRGSAPPAALTRTPPPPKRDAWEEVTDPAGGALTYWWNTDTDAVTALGEPKPKPAPGAAYPVPAPPSGPPGAPQRQGLGSVMAEGMAFGAGSSMARMAVGNIFGGGGSGGSAPPQEGGDYGAPVAPPVDDPYGDTASDESSYEWGDGGFSDDGGGDGGDWGGGDGGDWF